MLQRAFERPAPIPGQHTDEVIGEPRPTVTTPAANNVELRSHWDGITIIECGYYYATPFATTLLAELGARVIKVEPIAGDPYRLLGRGGGDPVTALGHNNIVRAMQGKEIDRTEPQGPPRPRGHLFCLGLKSRPVRPQLSRGNRARGTWGSTPRPSGSAEPPDSIYQYAASYGSTGPYAPRSRPSTRSWPATSRPDRPPDRRWQPTARARVEQTPSLPPGARTIDGARTLLPRPPNRAKGQGQVEVVR